MYGENVRVLVPIDSEEHGRVMVVCVGAMMVGSTIITRRPGERVRRAEELGYFKFGGSTLVLLFEPGRVAFDDDLVDNSNGALETDREKLYLWRDVQRSDVQLHTLSYFSSKIERRDVEFPILWFDALPRRGGSRSLVLNFLLSSSAESRRSSSTSYGTQAYFAHN